MAPIYVLDFSSLRWEYKQLAASDPEIPLVVPDWTTTSSFPSEVHVELIKAGLIPDPFVGYNEQQVQWIGDASWTYRASFPSPSSSYSAAVLQLDGLDTICDVQLNGKQILRTENMFRSYTIPVRSILQEMNELVLSFHSAKQVAKAREDVYGRVRAGSTNLGDPSRVYVRKAQYGWRWDWGPELMTVGPFRPIVLKAYATRIKDVSTYAAVSPSLESVKLCVTVDLDGSFPPSHSSIRVSFSSYTSPDNVIKTAVLELREEMEGTVEWDFHVDGEEGVGLWFPLGYGEQPLYAVKIDLLEGDGSDSDIIDTYTKSPIGFRAVRIIQEPLTVGDQYSIPGEGHGRNFVFEINGVRVFCGGSNLIPLSNFLTTLSNLPSTSTSSQERYRALVELTARGNQNMIRVWGGGVFAAEGEGFWEACDELGILVWHDFPFACGVYPAHSAPNKGLELEGFLESVDMEARDLVRRTMHHPSLAVFCGNNEDYQMVLQWGDVPKLPARKIYEEILPRIVRDLTTPPSSRTLSSAFPLLSDAPTLPPTELFGELLEGALVPYHPGSPYTGGKTPTPSSLASSTTSTVEKDSGVGAERSLAAPVGSLGGGWDTADPSVGDVHQWNIWGGRERTWLDYDVLGGRFISEFGLPSHPSMETMKTYGDWDEKKVHAQSPLIAQHTRAGMFERRFAIVMNEVFRITENLESYSYLTQLMQSEGVGYAYSVWRRAWRGIGKEETAGVLVWQLNDCWPVTSWAIIDYFYRPKPVYYNIKRQMAKYALGIYRTVEKNRPNDRPKQFYEFGAYLSKHATLGIWATTSSLAVTSGLLLEVESFDLASEWTHKTVFTDITLAPNQSTELQSLDCPAPEERDATVGGFYPPPLKGHTRTYTIVVCARLRKDGEIIARAVDWPLPYRYLTWFTELDPGLRVFASSSTSLDSVKLEVEASSPIKGLFFTLDLGLAKLQGGGAVHWDYDKVRWSDNALDVVPGERLSVLVEGSGVDKDSILSKLEAAWLGREKKSRVEVQWLD